MPTRRTESAVSRRRFQTAAIAATGTFVSRPNLTAASPAGEGGGDEERSANGSLELLVVGVANRAAANLAGVSGQKIVGLCDVDARYLDKAAATHPDARRFVDYREMIDAMAESADGIVVSTADHHHAPAAAMAMRRGLHAYVEKPLAHTVAETRLLTDLAKRHDVVTQMGTQIHAGENYRRVVELIRSDAIGPVRKVYVWVGKAWGGGQRPKRIDPVPDHLDWDRWIGPAPMRPYAKAAYHPAQWRRWWDFGGGTLGDMGCHYMDLPFWALGLTTPNRVVAEGPPPHPETAPTGVTVRYAFTPRAVLNQNDAPELELVWMDGDHAPKTIEGVDVPTGGGVLFVGDDGKLLSTYSSYQLLPEDQFADFTPPEPSIARSIGHHAEWIAACRGEGKTTCPFEYSGRLSESVLLGNVAHRCGQAFQYDGEHGTANQPAAAALLTKSYREGWDPATLT